MESLGGSRGRDGLGSSKIASMAVSRPLTPQVGVARGAAGGLSATMGAGGMGLRDAAGRGPARPSSAPPARPGGSKGAGDQGSGWAAKARVEELRHLKEAQFWGRVPSPKRDLPPFWSVAAHGQPFNDERLALGTSQHWKLQSPSGLKKLEGGSVGPATEVNASLRRSLELGTRLGPNLGASGAFSPKSTGGAMTGERLTDEERDMMLAKLPPQGRIHGLRNCLDRDLSSQHFVPWTQAIIPELDAAAWLRNRETCVRLAVQRLESLMRRHLKYLMEAECAAARAPATQTRHILQRAFWKVDPSKTGLVSIQQFLQVWQNVLQLWEYSDAQVASASGRRVQVLRPARRQMVDRSAAAALFVKYGFDREGLMPWGVFVQALCAAPARLLGHEMILDKAEVGKNGLVDEVDVAACVGDAKIIYPKCKSGVFPPSGFDPRVAFRSMMLPKAHMWLEHVYGYAGHQGASNNLFYTHNSKETTTEVVFYTGAVGVVFNREDFDAGKPSQRFFFGHDNDIQCLAMHPSRRYVVTGQQLSPGGVPYACIWDVDTCEQVQRLDHDQDCRSVIACTFSGNPASTSGKLGPGGSILLTVTSDDGHTIHVWRWMTNEDVYCKAQYIPGWFYGPEKKLRDLQANGLFFQQGDEESAAEQDSWPPKEDVRAAAAHKVLAKGANPHPLVVEARDRNVKAADAAGLHTQHKRSTADGTWELLQQLPGFNGTPPMIYGVSWNPFRPHDGSPGSEFVSYGVKHMKTWCIDDLTGQWLGKAASFGTVCRIPQNVLSAAFVPALHPGACPGDTCILAGFATGEVGLFLPPYPTRGGATYTLMRMMAAHAPGPLVTLNDGSQVHGGVCAVVLRDDGRTVLTAGADGFVVAWQLKAPEGNWSDGTPKTGVRLECLATPGEEYGPNRYKLLAPGAVLGQNEALPMVRSLDYHPKRTNEFVAGTDGCDIWEVDKDPRVLIEGHEDDVYVCASHPTDADTFATVCSSGKVRLFSAARRDVLLAASVGYPLSGVAFSQEAFSAEVVPGWAPEQGSGHHLAVSGKRGRLSILDARTLQPLVHMQDSKEAIDELKYSPAGGPCVLAAASHDLKIYLYKASRGYQLITRCEGHSGVVGHLDWSLPVPTPAQLRGRMLLMSTDTSREMLWWNPATGKRVYSNQRDAPMHSYTTPLGFPVMGIWPDYADGTDVNGVCRAKRGAPTFSPNALPDGSSQDAYRVSTAIAEESADGVPGCGYLVTCDDFAFVKLFNFPVVADDAPFRCYRGHSSHVTSVQFLCDDRAVVSVGSHDRGIYQWRTCGINMDDAQDDAAVLAAADMAVQQRLEGSSTTVPRALANWGALDSSGRNFGPVGTVERTSSRAAGAAGPSSSQH